MVANLYIAVLAITQDDGVVRCVISAPTNLTSPPEQWDQGNQDWENPQGHAAQVDAQETTRDEWDLL
ncbi:hypothetical protein CYMTET_40267 [Cymbomonas tetramitiformis]|uniref:Uncharacterized protein n=1 Tax=Cymbomonas tetramitiformis TaxID=36881 RepID=A0AAE0C8G2_9CHLO|nr:hypothetical protein CYMTET_40267 [Cymbomonas tetramitiformis]